MSKANVDSVRLIQGWGIEGDSHAGYWHRQVSFLALESIEKIRAKGLRVQPGAFAENITTEFLDIPNLAVGDRIRIGESELEVTQIGKECHSPCAIYYKAGDCVMPKEGVFAKVLRGGMLRVGDIVDILPVRETPGPRPAGEENPVPNPEASALSRSTSIGSNFLQKD